MLFAQADAQQSEKWSEEDATIKDDDLYSITGKEIHC